MDAWNQRTNKRAAALLRPPGSVRPAIIALCLATFAANIAAQAEHTARPSAVLAGDAGAIVLSQCSRPRPKDVHAQWDVPRALADVIDADLLSHETLPAARVTIHYPWTYARQYVGIIVNGKKLVYINAGVEGALDRPFVACDGGDIFWGAVYDPTTHAFSQVFANFTIDQ
jgi:hypothetical protein